MYKTVIRASPVLYFEKPIDEDTYDPKQIKTQKILCFRRWHDHISVVYLILGSSVSVYAVRQLGNVPHCQIPKTDIEAAKKLGARIKRKRPEFRLVLIGQTKYKDDFIMVDNTAKLSRISSIDWLQATREVDKERYGAVKDQLRKQVCVDLGVTGSLNSRREHDYFGLARPQVHKRTTQLWALRLMLRTSKLVPRLFGDTCPGMYRNHEREMHFAGKICRGNIVELLRLLSQVIYRGKRAYSPELLGLHVDSQNSKDDPNFRWVTSTSVILWDETAGEATRTAIITCGKQACDDFLRRCHVMLEPLRRLSVFWMKLPQHEKFVTKDTFVPVGQSWKTSERTHTMKSVIYSPYRDAIWRVMEAYPTISQDPMFLAALLHGTTCTNCPVHFWKSAVQLVKDPLFFGKHVEETDPLDFGCSLCRCLHAAKTGKPWPYGALDSPLVQEQGADAKTIQDSIVRIHHVMAECQAVPLAEIQAQIAYYHSRATAYLCQHRKDGSLNANPTMSEHRIHQFGCSAAQKLLGIAACLGWIEKEFLFYADLHKEDSTWRFFVDSWGFGCGDHLTLSDQLLSALSFHLGIQRMQSAEICRRFEQSSKNTNGVPCNSLPPGCPVVFLKRYSQDLFLLTHEGVTRLPRSNAVFQLPCSCLTDSSFWDRRNGRHTTRPRKGGRRATNPQSASTVVGVHGGNDFQRPLPSGFVPSRQSVQMAVRKPSAPTIDFSRILKQATSTVVPNDAFQWMAVRVFQDGRVEACESEYSDWEEPRRSKRTRDPRGCFPPQFSWHSFGTKFFCCGILLPASGPNGRSRVLWPEADFQLRRDFKGHQWQEGTHPSVHIQSLCRRGNRFFKSRADAREHALLRLLVQSHSRAAVITRGRRNLASNTTSEHWRTGTMSDVATLSGYCAFWRHSSRGGRVPYLVLVDYANGGQGFYLTTPYGSCTSGIHLVP